MKKIDGRYLRKLREKHGYSLREFAELVYASKSSVQRWEKSFAPEDSELLQKIADVYSLTVDEMREQSEKLFGDKKRKYSPEVLSELKFGIIFLSVLVILGFSIFLFFVLL